MCVDCHSHGWSIHRVGQYCTQEEVFFAILVHRDKFVYLNPWVIRNSLVAIVSLLEEGP